MGSNLIIAEWKPWKDLTENNLQKIQKLTENDSETILSDGTINQEILNDIISYLKNPLQDTSDQNINEKVIPSNSEGREFDLEQIIADQIDQKIINYDNYREVSFDVFYDYLWEYYKGVFGWEGDHYDGSGFFIDEKDLYLEKEIKPEIINLFKQAKSESSLDYYFYIKLEDILKVLKKYEFNNSTINVSNQNLDINDLQEILDNIKSISLTANERLIISETESLQEQFNTLKKLQNKRIPYISVNEIENFFNIESNDAKYTYTFQYHELQKDNKPLSKKITHIQINGPVGTAFMINREPKLFYITDYINIFTKDILDGYYDLDTEGYFFLKYITFPAETIPELVITSYSLDDSSDENSSDENSSDENGSDENSSNKKIKSCILKKGNKEVDICDYKITITIYYDE